MAGFLGALGGVLPLVGDLLKPAINQLSTKLYGSRAVTGYSRSERKSLVGLGGIPGAARDVIQGMPWGVFPGEGQPQSDQAAWDKYRQSQGLMRPPMVGPQGMSGYHWSRRLGRYVRNRRMNPCNPRALRRSMRRVASFAKFAKSAITFTQRVKMKKRKRR